MPFQKNKTLRRLAAQSDGKVDFEDVANEYLRAATTVIDSLDVSGEKEKFAKRIVTDENIARKVVAETHHSNSYIKDNYDNEEAASMWFATQALYNLGDYLVSNEGSVQELLPHFTESKTLSQNMKVFISAPKDVKMDKTINKAEYKSKLTDVNQHLGFPLFFWWYAPFWFGPWYTRRRGRFRAEQEPLETKLEFPESRSRPVLKNKMPALIPLKKKETTLKRPMPALIPLNKAAPKINSPLDAILEKDTKRQMPALIPLKKAAPKIKSPLDVIFEEEEEDVVFTPKDPAVIKEMERDRRREQLLMTKTNYSRAMSALKADATAWRKAQRENSVVFMPTDTSLQKIQNTMSARGFKYFMQGLPETMVHEHINSNGTHIYENNGKVRCSHHAPTLVNGIKVHPVDASAL